MVLDLIFPNGIHESCLGSSLYRGTIKREVLWGSVVTDELCQSITDVVAIDLLDRI